MEAGMRAIVGVLLLSAVAWPCDAQSIAQQSNEQLHIRSASAREVAFRVETQGSWVQVSRSSAITVRHEGAAKIVELTTPATLEIGGEGDLEVALLTSEPAARLELTALSSDTADGRRVFIYGDTIILRRSAGRPSLALHHADAVFLRRRRND
jgi:hypothetical protein